MFRQIPTLPVVLCLGAGAFAFSMWLLHRRRLLSVPRALVALAGCAYLAGILANTVFPIFLDRPEVDRPWSAGLALMPLTDYEVADAVKNILVFVPLGCLLPIVLATTSPRRVLTVAAGVSLAIEVTQYVSGRLLDGGHICDVNDLIFNVMGAAIGVALLRALSRIHGASEAIDRLRWTDPAEPRSAGRMNGPARGA